MSEEDKNNAPSGQGIGRRHVLAAAAGVGASAMMAAPALIVMHDVISAGNEMHFNDSTALKTRAAMNNSDLGATVGLLEEARQHSPRALLEVVRRLQTLYKINETDSIGEPDPALDKKPAGKIYATAFRTSIHDGHPGKAVESLVLARGEGALAAMLDNLVEHLPPEQRPQEQRGR